jgi:transposase
MTAILGIDIAKDSFDVTLLSSEKGPQRAQFANTASGHNRLHQWLQRHTTGQVHACMESTSIYWEELAEYLHQAGYQVSVVNPARIKGFAMSQMRRSKTDPLDGDVIADFCRTQQPAIWTPPTDEERKLRALVRHLETLVKSRTQQLNRLQTCRDNEVKDSLQIILQTIESEIQRVEVRIRSFFDDHPELKEKRDWLISIKGIGESTATKMLAEMYDLDEYENAKAAAADAGVTASHYSSGTSVRRRSKMSRMGKASIRGALYYPAITAIQHNPVVKQLAQRLAAKGKPKSVIHVAAMRKLMHLAYGVLKNKQPFNPDYATAAS